MNLNLLPLVNKARRPKFEVHLKIYDLNNVPLVHGASHIKWHLPHSINSDHRGRTPKCPIAHHRVEYNYTKIIPVRIAIDKTNALTECLIDFEIIQEFPSNSGSASGGAAAASGIPAVTNGGGGSSSSSSKEERITLGKLTLNLAEYVEESEAIMRDNHGFRAAQPVEASPKKRASIDTTASPKTHTDPAPQQSSDPLVEEGIIRRYLLTDAKINSTLKISLLVHQLDGERTFTAPPLKTAGAVFGGGILGGARAGEDFGQHFQDTHPEQDTANLHAAFNREAGGGGEAATASSRDAAAARHEAQDVYRRALAASWACQPGELPADECIEDIFSGGDGFGMDADDGADDGGGGGLASGGADVTPRRGASGKGHQASSSRGKRMFRRQDSESSSTGEAGVHDFLRPAGGGGGGGAAVRRAGSGRRRGDHVRQGSGESGVFTLRNDGRPGSAGGASVVSSSRESASGGHHHHHHHHQRLTHRRDGIQDSSPRGSGGGGGGAMRRDSLASLTSLTGSAMESDRGGRSGFKSAREVTEMEMREDFVAWMLPSTP